MIQSTAIKPALSPTDRTLEIICIYLYVPPLSHPYVSFLRDSTTLNFMFVIPLHFKNMGFSHKYLMLKNISFNFTV